MFNRLLIINISTAAPEGTAVNIRYKPYNQTLLLSPYRQSSSPNRAFSWNLLQEQPSDNNCQSASKALPGER